MLSLVDFLRFLLLRYRPFELDFKLLEVEDEEVDDEEVEDEVEDEEEDE